MVQVRGRGYYNVVLISGDRALPHAPMWGSGSFTIAESASLSLSYLQIDTMFQIDGGAVQLKLDSCLLTFAMMTLTSSDNVLFIGMNAVFGGHLGWIASASDASPTVQLCNAD